MQFEDMKKIWDTQANEPLYGINQSALEKQVFNKKSYTMKRTNWSEWVAIASHTLLGGVLLLMQFIKGGDHLFENIMGVFMLGMAAYIWWGRRRRMNWEKRFEQSLLGNLEEAIFVANYQLNLSRSMFVAFLVIMLLYFLQAYADGKSMTYFVWFITFFLVVVVVAVWEYKGLYVSQYNELKRMRDKLLELK